MWFIQLLLTIFRLLGMAADAGLLSRDEFETIAKAARSGDRQRMESALEALERRLGRRK